MTVQEILQQCTVSGLVVKLPDIKLERDLYEQVKKKLNGIGGAWKSGKTQGFVFDHDPAELLASIAAGEEINLQKDYQFFATPPELAKKMAGMFMANKETKILEPSAGDGALVKAVFDTWHGVKQIDCFELMEINRLKLEKLPGAHLVGTDFLGAVHRDRERLDNGSRHRFIGEYDVIIANPPFTKNQDIDHIRAMWECLKPGGVIVTVSSFSWTFGSQKKQKEFREWLDSMGAYREELPEGTFAESGTNVNAMLLRIDKPAAERSVDISEDIREGAEQMAAGNNGNGNGHAKKEDAEVVPKTEIRTLKHEFTVDEMNEFAQNLARETRNIQQLEEEKKSVVSQYASKINEAKATAHKLSSFITDGFEYRQIECEIQYHTPEKGKKTIIRKGIGIIESVEPMEPFEWNLFNQPKEEEEEIFSEADL